MDVREGGGGGGDGGHWDESDELSDSDPEDSWLDDFKKVTKKSQRKMPEDLEGRYENLFYQDEPAPQTKISEDELESIFVSQQHVRWRLTLIVHITWPLFILFTGWIVDH